MRRAAGLLVALLSGICLSNCGSPAIHELETSSVSGLRPSNASERATTPQGKPRSTSDALVAAYAWLAQNQESDGRWSSVKFGGKEGLDVAVTGLATLSFLGAYHTERQGRYADTVRKAVAWLISNQNAEGCLADDAAKRASRLGTSHAIAGLALAEAYAIAHVGKTGEAAQKAVTYSIDVHQRPKSGWGEKPKGEPSTLVTGWFTMQLKSAKLEGLKVEDRAFQGAIACLERMTPSRGENADIVGVVRTRPGGEPSPTATVVATFARQLLGWKRTDPIIIDGSDLVLAHLLKSDARKLDREFLFWAWHAMGHEGGRHWREWSARVCDMLVSTQRSTKDDTMLDGSWDPVASDVEFGRVGATAFVSMCLEAANHHCLPLYK